MDLAAFVLGLSITAMGSLLLLCAIGFVLEWEEAIHDRYWPKHYLYTAQVMFLLAGITASVFFGVYRDSVRREQEAKVYDIQVGDQFYPSCRLDRGGGYITKDGGALSFGKEHHVITERKEEK
jgi:hypothetical protein